MAKWNLIPSAEGPFSDLDAMARYCFGLLYDRYKLSMRKHSEGDSRFSEVRTVRRCLEDLRRAGVIETKREGYNGALRFFFPPVVYEYFEREERLKEYKAILAGREG